MQVSIIIPTINRASYLKDTLTSVIQQSFPHDQYEILVIDNGSNDNTRQVTEEFINTYPGNNIHYLYEPEPGLLSGRHRGAKEANGDILTFVDDDIKTDSGWLAAIVEAFQDPSVHLVGGPCLPDYESNPPPWLESYWEQNEYGRLCGWLSLLDFGEELKKVDPIYIWGLNYSIRRKTLFEAGGFHPDTMPKHLQRFQGDGETGLSIKIKERGLTAVYHPKALVWHKVTAERMTIDYFEKRAYFQAVANSFTQIRREGKCESQPKKQNRLTWLTPVLMLRFVLRRISHHKPYEGIRRRTDRAYNTGIAFHQKEVANDPELLRWVLKEDYFDYKLPFYRPGNKSPNK